MNLPLLRKASLATVFLTVFLDLLGFGLVVPFLPGVARDLGASDFVAALIGASYSLMQFLFVPIWGRLSDRLGRRPILLWSIAANVVGMTLLGSSSNLTMLFAARMWSGIATANIAVAQAYVADVTTPETRARGMGLIGVAFGLGFILGPFIGGELSRVPLISYQGDMAAFAAAALSAVNLVLAVRTLPESLSSEARRPSRRSAAALDLRALRVALTTPGGGAALWISFLVIFWFAGMEQTFRLFTEDGFRMDAASTGRVFAVVGIVAAIVQGGLIHPLTRAFGEGNLIRAGALVLAVGFTLLGTSPDLPAGGRLALFASGGLIALGSGLATPSLSSYVSRCTSLEDQGAALGALQSVNALARVVGPAAGGLLYQSFGRSAPYFLGAAGMAAAALLAVALSARPAPPAAPRPR